MYITEQMIKECEDKYGKPKAIRLNYPTPADHFDFIRSTQKNGRANDITLYVYHNNKLAVTRKPMYPLGAFRPPSGGLNPGESFEDGAYREGWEELGLKLALKKYLMRVRVDFVRDNDRIIWTSHIFQAVPSDDNSDLSPNDHDEIVDAVWADEAEFFTSMRNGLLSVGSTGLLYRVHLHDIMWRLYGWDSGV